MKWKRIFFGSFPSFFFFFLFNKHVRSVPSLYGVKMRWERWNYRRYNNVSFLFSSLGSVYWHSDVLNIRHSHLLTVPLVNVFLYSLDGTARLTLDDDGFGSHCLHTTSFYIIFYEAEAGTKPLCGKVLAKSIFYLTSTCYLPTSCCCFILFLI